MLCKNCDTRNEDASRFCRACGAPLLASASTSAWQPVSFAISDPPTTGPGCPACARTNPLGARYCVYCATPLTTPVTGGVMLLQPAYVAVPAPVYVSPAVTVTATANTHLLLRALWFVFVGWWLGLVWTIMAWLFNLTLIGLPVGLAMLNAIPMVTSLHHRRGYTAYHAPRPIYPANPLALRAIWFVVIGWWASLIWTLVAFAFSLTFILMPISFWMWNRLPTITTLAAES